MFLFNSNCSLKKLVFIKVLFGKVAVLGCCWYIVLVVWRSEVGEQGKDLKIPGSDYKIIKEKSWDPAKRPAGDQGKVW